jgi:flagellar basal-body rod modification protein FlgD
MPNVSDVMGARNAAGMNVPNKHSSFELSAQDFMKLFITQLQNQNPTSPMDSSTMLQQVANLGQLSSASNAQQTMKELQASVQASLGETQYVGATQIIGKRILIPQPLSPMIPNEGISGAVALEQAANNVTVSIKDSSGKVIHTLDLGASGSGGLMDFHWDGKIDGKEVPNDIYQISAVAMVNGKQTPALKTAGAFKVSSVALDKQSGSVIVNADKYGGLAMSDILKIM